MERWWARPRPGLLVKRLREGLGWLARGLVLAFAAAAVLPARGFVAGMDRDALLLWTARLCWVLGVPVVFWCILKGVGWWCARQRSPRNPDL